jgi:hypothetical protein
MVISVPPRGQISKSVQSALRGVDRFMRQCREGSAETGSKVVLLIEIQGLGCLRVIEIFASYTMNALIVAFGQGGNSCDRVTWPSTNEISLQEAIENLTAFR